MQIKQTENGIAAAEVPQLTDQEMRNEYNYFLAEQLTKKLFDKGLLTEEEFERVMTKNRQSFSPFISKIIP